MDPIYCRLPVGTPDYIAPDILQHAEELFTISDLSDAMDAGSQCGHEDHAQPFIQPYSPQVDWWSLGVTFYEMAFGTPPFWAPSIPETYNKIINHVENLRMPSRPQISRTLTELITGSVDLSTGMSDGYSFLRPSSQRLGRNGVSEVKVHAFFQSPRNFDHGKQGD